MYWLLVEKFTAGFFAFGLPPRQDRTGGIWAEGQAENRQNS